MALVGGDNQHFGDLKWNSIAYPNNLGTPGPDNMLSVHPVPDVDHDGLFARELPLTDAGTAGLVPPDDAIRSLEEDTVINQPTTTSDDGNPNFSTSASRPHTARGTPKPGFTRASRNGEYYWEIEGCRHGPSSGQPFRRMDMLNRHKKGPHAIEPRAYRCLGEGCTYKSHRKDKMREHVHNKHANQGVVECAVAL